MMKLKVSVLWLILFCLWFFFSGFVIVTSFYRGFDRGMVAITVVLIPVCIVNLAKALIKWLHESTDIRL